MTPNEYQKLAMRTASRVSTATKDNLMLQGVMGAAGEAGEAIDLVKKAIFQGHELDPKHLVLELGDILWYVATCAESIGVPLEKVMEMNIDKLRNRYPEKFDADLSIHRKEGDI